MVSVLSPKIRRPPTIRKGTLHTHFIYIYICMYVCMYVCVCVCVCVCVKPHAVGGVCSSPPAQSHEQSRSQPQQLVSVGQRQAQRNQTCRSHGTHDGTDVLRLTCPDVLKLTCPDVLKLTCPDVLLLACPDVLRLTCPDVLLLTFPDVLKLIRPDVLKLTCPDVLLLTYPDVLKLTRPDVLKLTCPDVGAVQGPVEQYEGEGLAQQVVVLFHQNVPQDHADAHQELEGFRWRRKWEEPQ